MQPFPSQPILFVDNSLIELITTCPWKAYAAVMLRRRRGGEEPALRQGSHVHSALAYRYRREAIGLPWSGDVQQRILAKRYEQTPCESEEWRNLDYASQIICAYNEQYPFEQFEVIRHGPHSFPFVERPFAVELPEKIDDITIFYVGRMDLAVRDSNGHLYVMDHKTTSVLGDTYWDDAFMSEQQHGYCWALREVLGEEPVGYIMNVLAVRKPSKTGKGVEFARRTYPTREPPGKLDEWYSNMVLQVRTFLHHFRNSLWPRHHKHCISKYGRCEFYRVCELPEHSRSAALASSAFKDNDWSPLYK